MKENNEEQHIINLLSAKVECLQDIVRTKQHLREHEERLANLDSELKFIHDRSVDTQIREMAADYAIGKILQDKT